MLWKIFFDKQYVGTVIAKDRVEARARAEEKFKAINWDKFHVEASTRQKKFSKGIEIKMPVAS